MIQALIVVVVCTLNSLLNYVTAVDLTKPSEPTLCNFTGCVCWQSSHYFFININCTFTDDQIIDLTEHNLPEQLKELIIIGGQRVQIHSYAFQNVKSFEKFIISTNQEVYFKKYAFLKHQSLNFFVEISDSQYVEIGSETFVNMAGPLTANFQNCAHIRIVDEAFSWLLSARFDNVTNLDLAEKAFVLQPSRISGRHGVATNIMFTNVYIPRVPKHCFGSTISELSFVRSKIVAIEPEAITANTISAFMAINSSIETIHENAFSDNTFLNYVLIQNSWINTLHSKSVQSAIDNLTITSSRIKKIEKGAINITASKVLIEQSTFDLLNIRSIILKELNNFRILNSTFREIKPNSIRVSTAKDYLPEILNFKFQGNEFYQVDRHGLYFLFEIVEKTNIFEIKENFFEKLCTCKKSRTWLTELFARNSSHHFYQQLIESNFCRVEDILLQCFSLDSKLINIKQFMKQICHNESQIAACKPYNGSAKLLNAPIATEPTLRFPPNTYWWRKSYVCSTITLVILVICSGSLVMYLTKKHSTIVKIELNNCLRKCFDGSDNDLTDATDDIIINTIDKRNISTMTSMMDLDDHHESRLLPNELSQDLLQNLREKLDNPQTFNEARQMIEQLYDRFIIENEYKSTPTLKCGPDNDENHYYEELSSIEQRLQNNQVIEKTRPFGFLKLIEDKFRFFDNNNLITGDYSEPNDAEHHIYSELPLQRQLQPIV